MELEVEKNTTVKDKNKGEADDLLKQLNKTLNKKTEEKKLDKSQYNFADLSEKFKKNYWEHRIGHMEDDIASTIGLSRSTYEIMGDSLTNEIDKSIAEIATRENTVLYRKEFDGHGGDNDKTYSVDKYEINSKEVKHEDLKLNNLLDKYEDEDIIFQYDEKNNIIVRDDLKQEAIYKACEKCMKYKKEQDKEIAKYKIEGHMYQVVSGLPENRLEDVDTGEMFDDIDFGNDIDDGTTSVYQVQDGEYVKVYDGYYEDAIFEGEIEGEIDDNSLSYYVKEKLNLPEDIKTGDLNERIDELVRNTVLKYSEDKNTIIYMKEENSHKVKNQYFYDVYKFENGEMEKLEINEEDIPRKWWDNNLIYQYNDKGEIVARFDLYEEIREIAEKNSKSIDRREIIDAQNFINQLGKKYKLDSKELAKLENKIEKLLKNICGNFADITHFKYDKESNKFYEVIYKKNNVKMKKINDDYLKRFVGEFRFHSKDNPKIYEYTFILDKDITKAINKQLKKDGNINNLDFSELEKKYSDPKYIEKIFK